MSLLLQLWHLSLIVFNESRRQPIDWDFLAKPRPYPGLHCIEALVVEITDRKGVHWGQLRDKACSHLQTLEVLPEKALQISLYLCPPLFLKLLDLADGVNLSVEVQDESVNPVVVLVVRISLDQDLGQLECSQLIEPALADSVSNLTHLGCKHAHNLAEGALNKRVWGHTKDVIIVVE